MKVKRVSKIWFRMLTTEYSYFECRCIRTHTEEKPSKIYNITFAILTFYQKKKSWMIILSTMESIYLDESIKCASRWFILAQRTQNLEFVSLKCVTYTQPIRVSLIFPFSEPRDIRNHQSIIIVKMSMFIIH